MNDPQDNLVGRIFSDRYRLTRKVGEGAMGQVYLARHTFMDKNVAIKVLHPGLLGHDEVVERFQREAKAAAHIEHPNVCAATDFGRYDDDGLFLVMEWLDGRSLDDVIVQEGPLPLERVVHIASQIAAALQRAHDLKIVHRDLKPANVMLVKRDGDPDFVKVTDFGVARVPIGASSKLTQAGTTYGTPYYMSPEQAAGDEIDHRTDVYALGVTIFEMLTGQVPFEGASVAHILSMHVTEPVPLPSSLRAELPPNIDALVLKCMAKLPADRFQSADEVLAALETLNEGFAETRDLVALPTSASSAEWARETASELVRDARTRSPKALLGIGAVAIVAIGMAVWIGLGAGRAVGDKVEAVKQASLAEERLEFARQPEIAKALELQAQGKGDDAVAALRSAELNYQGNPHFHFLLGSALQNQGKSVDAFEEFRKSVKLRKDYGQDNGLRQAVLNAAQLEGSDTALQSYLREDADTELIQQVFALATGDLDRKPRERVVSLLKADGVFERLSREQQVAVEVR
ncbi:MAG: protein kinase, partial [bacterium]